MTQSFYDLNISTLRYKFNNRLQRRNLPFSTEMYVFFTSKELTGHDENKFQSYWVSIPRAEVTMLLSSELQTLYDVALDTPDGVFHYLRECDRATVTPNVSGPKRHQRSYELSPEAQLVFVSHILTHNKLASEIARLMHSRTDDTSSLDAFECNRRYKLS